jgi:hypothetical protein
VFTHGAEDYGVGLEAYPVHTAFSHSTKLGAFLWEVDTAGLFPTFSFVGGGEHLVTASGKAAVHLFSAGNYHFDLLYDTERL